MFIPQVRGCIPIIETRHIGLAGRDLTSAALDVGDAVCGLNIFFVMQNWGGEILQRVDTYEVSVHCP